MSLVDDNLSGQTPGTEVLSKHCLAVSSLVLVTAVHRVPGRHKSVIRRDLRCGEAMLAGHDGYDIIQTEIRARVEFCNRVPPGFPLGWGGFFCY
jgi:hypothetical protein